MPAPCAAITKKIQQYSTASSPLFTIGQKPPFACTMKYATAIWPPSGIAVAALLLGGGRLWPAIWAGSFAANITIDWAYVASTIIATGSTLQALAIAGLVREHIGVLHRFETVEHVVRFVLIAALGCTIAPTFALLPLGAFYQMSAVELAGNWATWWQGDACGVLIFVPLILSWLAPSTSLACSPPSIQMIALPSRANCRAVVESISA